MSNLNSVIAKLQDRKETELVAAVQEIVATGPKYTATKKIKLSDPELYQEYIAIWSDPHTSEKDCTNRWYDLLKEQRPLVFKKGVAYMNQLGTNLSKRGYSEAATEITAKRTIRLSAKERTHDHSKEYRRGWADYQKGIPLQKNPYGSAYLPNGDVNNKSYDWEAGWQDHQVDKSGLQQL